MRSLLIKKIELIYFNNDEGKNLIVGEMNYSVRFEIKRDISILKF